MEQFIAIVKSTAGVLDKYQDFDTEKKAAAHVAQYDGWVAPYPGSNNTNYWVIDEQAKTLAYDQARQDTDDLDRAFAELRRERDQLLNNTDWWVLRGPISEAQTTYRQALRDLPAATADPANPTWPVEP